MTGNVHDNPLLRFLTAPDTAPSLTLADWDSLLQQARVNQLLARVAVCVDDRNLWDRVPAEVCPHLKAGLALASKQRRDVFWELNKIHGVLADLGCPLVILKGAAYMAADLPPGRGRVFSDIDIMVPESHLSQAEQLLLAARWRYVTTDAYDHHYYRSWTHQLPPLQHTFRGSVLDLHHTIVPKTARIALDAAALFEASRPASATSPYRVLAPEDMVLHSAVHLFNDGDFGHGLRDLFDLNDLIRHFARDPAFWPHLISRAEMLDLRRPVAYAIRHIARALGEELADAPWQRTAAWLAPGPVRAVLDRMFDEALAPGHVQQPGPIARMVDWSLDARGHYLRMPLHILVPHLIRKAVKKPPDQEDTRLLPPLAGAEGSKKR